MYYNRSYYPTLPEYFQYLSEQFKLPHPLSFTLRKEYPKSCKGKPNDPNKYLIRDVTDFKEGNKLVLMRNKDKLNPEEPTRKRDIKGQGKD